MSLCVCGHAEEKHWGILPGAHCRHHECVDSRPNVGCREFRPASLAEQGATAVKPMTVEQMDAVLEEIAGKPLLRCGRCQRRGYADAGEMDMLTQPDGYPCGGRFQAKGASGEQGETVEGEAATARKQAEVGVGVVVGAAPDALRLPASEDSSVVALADPRVVKLIAKLRSLRFYQDSGPEIPSCVPICCDFGELASPDRLTVGDLREAADLLTELIAAIQRETELHQACVPKVDAEGMHYCATHGQTMMSRGKCAAVGGENGGS